MFDRTVRNKESSALDVYLDDLVRMWILEKDGVLDSEGGATWENLKKALEDQKHLGIAKKIVSS